MDPAMNISGGRRKFGLAEIKKYVKLDSGRLHNAPFVRNVRYVFNLKIRNRYHELVAFIKLDKFKMRNLKFFIIIPHYFRLFSRAFCFPNN